MADFCQLGYLNEFVMPDPGWYIQAPILSWLDADKRLTHIDIWQKIQDDGVLQPPVKALSQDNIRTILEWMYAHGLIGKPETDQITYEPA
jgi:hypothetical protein